MAGVLSSMKASYFTPNSMRALCSSSARSARFRSGVGAAAAPPPLKEIGRLIPPRKETEGPYPPGQLFLHKLFAYRGVVICSFNCVINEKPRSPQKGEFEKTETSHFYQVLIHRGDWRHLHFPVDITSYLGDAGSRGEKLLTFINGMDCVQHNEIIPFTACDAKPLEHDLFERIFEVAAEKSDEKSVEFTIRKELISNYFSNQRSWLSPQEVYRETTNGVRVTVTTFYLGSNIINGHQKHCWRYVIRVENLENTTVILRERSMKVFSLNNMQQVNAQGVVGTNPKLSPQEPAFQFSSTIDLPQPKGAHLWGKFKMERENGSCFDVIIPTIRLEISTERTSEQTEKQLQ